MVDWNVISRNRSSLMGVAIILIMMFHSSCAWGGALTSLFGCGDFGVEIFIFLSAVGLSKSLSKRPSLTAFYKKRLIRILPAYCAVAVPMALVRYFAYGATWKQVVLFSLGLSYFRGEWTYWFISFILFCYLWAPFLYRLKKKIKTPFVLFLIFLAISMTLHFGFKETLSYWNTLIVRFPVFILGLDMADFILRKNGQTGRNVYTRLRMPLMALVIAFVVFSLIKPLPDDLRYYIYLILTIPVCYSISSLLDCMPKTVKVLNWIGGITLELYVLHEHICIPIANHICNIPFIAFMISLLLAFIGAKALSLSINGLTTLIQRHV